MCSSDLYVNVVWLGASPQDVEEQIIVRLEEAASQIEGVDKLWTIANEGAGGMYVIGKQNLDPATFLQKIEREVNAINTFPAAAKPPSVRNFASRNEIFRIAVSGNVDERLLKRTAEKIRREVAMLPFVPSVGLFGVRGEEVSIEVSETALKRYGLTLNEVALAVRGTSLNSSLGSVRTGLGPMQLRTRGQADTKEEFENIVVRQLANGAAIRVGDVAEDRKSVV